MLYIVNLCFYSETRLLGTVWCGPLYFEYCPKVSSTLVGSLQEMCPNSMSCLYLLIKTDMCCIRKWEFENLCTSPYLIYMIKNWVERGWTEMPWFSCCPEASYNVFVKFHILPMALHRLSLCKAEARTWKGLSQWEQEIVLHSLTRLAPESTVFSKDLQVCRTSLFKAKCSLNSFSWPWLGGWSFYYLAWITSPSGIVVPKRAVLVLTSHGKTSQWVLFMNVKKNLFCTDSFPFCN